jgi:hypothetical protein
MLDSYALALVAAITRDEPGGAAMRPTTCTLSSNGATIVPSASAILNEAPTQRRGPRLLVGTAKRYGGTHTEAIMAQSVDSMSCGRRWPWHWRWRPRHRPTRPCATRATLEANGGRANARGRAKVLLKQRQGQLRHRGAALTRRRPTMS